ncbi:hypothetical protein J2S70_000564 [Trueperella bonasi]|uniref:Putative host cell surface-exposed lipoprotein Ltp-like HTH region domain-containing protein n=1 Tax=Trueperella bonasi TaxID=312286 RepID=A0ABT9NF30_9ACTO|nr:Ltp family lipoprotein [Trueperella bonasi]MDP9805982.1 hypothetical protein [Trueperella bonasi]
MRERLTAEYGSNFTKEETEYALDNLDVDWNEQALRAAEEHLEFTPTAPIKRSMTIWLVGMGNGLRTSRHNTRSTTCRKSSWERASQA